MRDDLPDASQDMRGASRLEERADQEGYTDASAELGLPIEGYRIGETDSGRKSIDEETGTPRPDEWAPPPVLTRGSVILSG